MCRRCSDVTSRPTPRGTDELTISAGLLALGWCDVTRGRSHTQPRLLIRGAVRGEADNGMQWPIHPITAAGPRWICTTLPFSSRNTREPVIVHVFTCRGITIAERLRFSRGEGAKRSSQRAFPADEVVNGRAAMALLGARAGGRLKLVERPACSFALRARRNKRKEQECQRPGFQGLKSLETVVRPPGEKRGSPCGRRERKEKRIRAPPGRSPKD